MSADAKLLPCPFCGSPATEYNDGAFYFAGCMNNDCPATNPVGMSAACAEMVSGYGYTEYQVWFCKSCPNVFGVQTRGQQ